MINVCNDSGQLPLSGLVRGFLRKHITVYFRVMEGECEGKPEPQLFVELILNRSVL